LYLIVETSAAMSPWSATIERCVNELLESREAHSDLTRTTGVGVIAAGQEPVVLRSPFDQLGAIRFPPPSDGDMATALRLLAECVEEDLRIVKERGNAPLRPSTLVLCATAPPEDDQFPRLVTDRQSPAMLTVVLGGADMRSSTGETLVADESADAHTIEALFGELLHALLQASSGVEPQLSGVVTGFRRIPADRGSQRTPQPRPSD
jgi:uncharacterized protein YegL